MSRTCREVVFSLRLHGLQCGEFSKAADGSVSRTCRERTFCGRLSVPVSRTDIAGTFVRRLSVSILPGLVEGLQ